MINIKTPFLLLGFLLQTISFAGEPTASQLELSYQLTESVRSPVAAASIFVIPKVFPFAAQLVGVDNMAVTIALIPVGWGTSFAGFTGIQTYKKNALVKNILAECAASLVFNCTLDDQGIIRFTNPKTNEEIGSLRANRKLMAIEIESNPFKLKDTEGKMGEILETALYKTARKSGLRNILIGGKSPISVEFSSLFGDSKKGINYQFFRNYMVDWANHDELYYGALHYDKKSAQPLLNTENKKNAFEKWLTQYDLHLKNGSMDEQTFTSMRESLAKDCEFGKNAALNVMATSDTIEVNSLRTNKNFADLQRKLNILQSRARFVHSQSDLIPYYRAGSIQNAQDGVNRFHLYLKESGLDWNVYREILPPAWKKKVPEELSVDRLFARGKNTPPVLFRTCTRFIGNLFAH